VIEPRDGFFQGKETKTFSIKFSAEDLIPCYDIIHPTIRNIPLESVKNPPPHILEQIKDLQAKNNGLDQASSAKKIEFIYYTWQLIGEVSPMTYSIDPP